MKKFLVKALRAIALDKSVAVEFVDLYGKLPNKEMQKGLEEFVAARDIKGDDLNDLMYDLQNTHRMMALKKPEVKKKDKEKGVIDPSGFKLDINRFEGVDDRSEIIVSSEEYFSWSGYYIVHEGDDEISSKQADNLWLQHADDLEKLIPKFLEETFGKGFTPTAHVWTDVRVWQGPNDAWYAEKYLELEVYFDAGMFIHHAKESVDKKLVDRFRAGEVINVEDYFEAHGDDFTWELSNFYKPKKK